MRHKIYVKKFKSSYLSFRSSCPKVFCKKGVFRNFAKFIRKHLCQSLFLGMRPATLLKKRLWNRCFPVNFAKFLRTSFLKENVRWLLLFLWKIIYETLRASVGYWDRGADLAISRTKGVLKQCNKSTTAVCEIHGPQTK